ncbi:MAG: hypothetical protein M1816_003803 [Peltula sp. TS41687]|nr:MAG: hypothetical protein M1816_003803 [Peltula sp. TS41687]
MSSGNPTFDDLIRRVQAAERATEEAKQRAEEERLRAEDEKRLRRAAEEKIRPLSVLEALELWHKLYAKPPIHPREIGSSQITNPVGRLYPKQLRRWTEFHQLHRAAFEDLIQAFDDADGHPLASRQSYEDAASEFMRHVRLRHEPDLVDYVTRTVEVPAMNLWLRKKWTVTFDHRTRVSLEDLSDRLTLADVQEAAGPSTPQPRRFFDRLVYLTDPDGKKRPIFVIEYKAAHLLTPELISDGLHEMDLQPIIDRHKRATDETKKRRELAEEAVAAVVTQTFDYMIDQGVSYGYATGEEGFILLSIRPDDPNTLFYEYVSTAQAEGPDETIQHRLSAVGLVAGFTGLAATHGRPLESEWSRRARKALDRWVVNPENILAACTPTPPAQRVRESPAYPGRKSAPDPNASPAQTRSKSKLARCQDQEDDQPLHQSDQSSEDEHDDSYHPGTTGRPPPPLLLSGLARENTRSASSHEKKASGNSNNKTKNSGGTLETMETMQPRSFCTHACLLGLVRRRVLDDRCPNVAVHRGEEGGRQHRISLEELTSLVGTQLNRFCDQLNKPYSERDNDECYYDIEFDGCFESLDLSGWAGALFRVTLFSHGYTFVGKGTVKPLVPALKKEADVYTRLKKIQGKAVPIYLGSVDLRRAYYLTSLVPIVHVLLMSWSGPDLLDCGVDKQLLDEETRRTVREVERLGVRQGDVRPQNLLWNEELGRVILIDFECATIISKEHVEPVTPKKRPMLGGIDGNDRRVHRQEVVKATMDEEREPPAGLPVTWAE